MKRFLSIFLAAIMCCSLLSVGVLAEGEAVESCTEHEDCAGHAELADESAPVSVLAVEELISAVAESVEEASAEESAETLQYGCEVHTPGETVEADYTECGGGWTVDHYWCTVCYLECDAEGNALDWNKIYKEGTGKHTPGELWWEADYTECGGGWIVDRYWCEYCGDACDAEGNAVNWDEMYKEGTGKHTPGETVEADYTECGGGFTVDYYWCTVCYWECDAEGNDPDWNKIYKEGNGKHTPGEMLEANYTECGGGWIVDYSWCDECGLECDAEGNELSWEDDYKEGNDQHTPGRKLKAYYTECGGGWIVDRYVCTECGWYCDAEGKDLYWYESYEDGTGQHTPGRKYEADYTECGGGLTVDYYGCKVCGAECDAKGNELDWNKYYKEGAGKHTPGETVEADYTKCGGGYTVDHYYCTVCYWECDAEGNALDWNKIYKEGNGKHTPGTKRYEANFTECFGGFTEPYYSCTVCGQSCTANGKSAYSYIYEEGYGHVFESGVCKQCDLEHGDINENGELDARDLVRLMRGVSFGASVYYFDREDFDVNEDGSVDILDVICLARKLA